MNEHSEKFFDVKEYYSNGFWNKAMVKNAIGRWITQEEYNEIIKGDRNA